MKNCVLIIILFMCTLFTNIIHSQNIFGPDTAGFKRYVQRFGNNPPQCSGYLYNSNVTPIGNDGSSNKYRAFYQWNVPDNIIPDGSQIDTVIVFFTYSPFVSNYYMSIKYSDISGDLQNPDAQTMWEKSALGSSYEIGSGQGNKYGYQGTSLDTVISVFVSGSDFCNAIQNSLEDDKFVLGITSQAENYAYEWYIDNFSLTMCIVYSPPQHLVKVEQKLLNSTSNIDSVGLWNSYLKKFDKFKVPGSFNWDDGSSKTLQGSQKLLSNQKYHHWENNSQKDNNVVNHKTFWIYSYTSNLTSRFNPSASGVSINNSLEGTTTNGGNIKFADPWYIDYADPLFGGSPRNRGMKDSGPDSLQYRERISPFYPDNTTLYQNENDPAHAYQGIFLDQPYTGTNPVYYSVQALSSQTIPLDDPIGSRDFYFQYWDYDENEISLKAPGLDSTGVVFKEADATLSAVLKGHLLSNDENALSNGSQRRLARTDNGIYHLVYESMGGIWYTYSLTTGFNGDWHAEICINEGKNPSIDYYENKIKIVYEDPLYIEEGVITIETYAPDLNGNYTREGAIQQPASFPISYYGKAKPVITFNDDITYVAYRKNNSEGIYQSFCYNAYPWYERIIQGTNNCSENPSIKCSPETKTVYLVYDNSAIIEYVECVVNDNANWYYFPEDISSGSGNNINRTPCISLASNYNVPIVSWIGYYSSAGIGKITGNSTGDVPPMVVVRRKGSKGWGSFFKTSSNVTSVNSNSSGSGIEQTVITWSEGTAPNYQSKWVRRVGALYSDPHSLSSNGIQTQVSNGTDLSNMGGVLLSTATTPYDLPVLTTDFNQLFLGLSKIKKLPDLAYGREGIIYKNGVEFLFDIGDVIVEDSVIKFICRPDTLTYNSTGELNEVVRTESFQLNSSTDFYFTDFYYVLNSDAADTLLTANDLVNFKAEIVNSETGNIAGTFDNITFTKEQLDEHNNVSYKVDCSNITPGSYYLRLVTTVHGNAEYYLADVQNNEEELQKHNYEQINFDGEKLPETYDLSQNYPNPFNPATTINYQLPQTGFVTLKIYDILGKEVATLVNEQKNQGRHSVNFDASKLASGVYIYQLHSNDYVSSKKMLLIK